MDAPAVLGWQEWREIDKRYGLGLMKAALGGAIEAGVLRNGARPVGHLMLGAMAEAAFVIANAADPPATRDQAETALLELLEGLTPEGGARRREGAGVPAGADRLAQQQDQSDSNRQQHQDDRERDSGSFSVNAMTTATMPSSIG